MSWPRVVCERYRPTSIAPGPGWGYNRPRNAADSSEAELYFPKKWARPAALQELVEGAMSEGRELSRGTRENRN